MLYGTENGPDCDDKIQQHYASCNYGRRPKELGWRCGDDDPKYNDCNLSILSFTPCPCVTGCTFYTGDQYPEFKFDMFFTECNTGRIQRLRLNGEAFDQVDQFETF